MHYYNIIVYIVNYWQLLYVREHWFADGPLVAHIVRGRLYNIIYYITFCRVENNNGYIICRPPLTRWTTTRVFSGISNLSPICWRVSVPRPSSPHDDVSIQYIIIIIITASVNYRHSVYNIVTARVIFLGKIKLANFFEVRYT